MIRTRLSSFTDPLIRDTARPPVTSWSIRVPRPHPELLTVRPASDHAADWPVVWTPEAPEVAANRPTPSNQVA